MKPELVPTEYLNELLSVEGEYYFVFSSLESVVEFVKEFYRPTKVYSVKEICESILMEVKSWMQKSLSGILH
jgi:hypothetical protein